MGQHNVLDTPTGSIPGYRADPHIPPKGALALERTLGFFEHSLR